VRFEAIESRVHVREFGVVGFGDCFIEI